MKKAPNSLQGIYHRTIKNFFEREKYIWNNNAEEIEEINNKIAILLIVILCIASFGLSIISTAGIIFSELRMPYYVLFVLTLSMLFIGTAETKMVSPLSLLYFIHTLIMLFATYSAAYVLPDSLSTLVLGFIFVFSLTVFDKMVRVNLTMIGYLVIYLLLASPIKNPNIVVMDLMNVLCFAIVGMILGGYLRQLQLDNIDLKRQSRLRARTDCLTQLPNRASIVEVCSCTDKVSKIGAIVMIDIDYFKLYNDTYGHQQGDKCLISVAKAIKEIDNKYESTFFRYGGEEFMGIIWRTESALPYSVCDDLLNKINNLNIPHKTSPYEKVTVSIGLTKVTSNEDNNLVKLISQADAALYKSKQSGRNKITSY